MDFLNMEPMKAHCPFVTIDKQIKKKTMVTFTNVKSRICLRTMNERYLYHLSNKNLEIKSGKKKKKSYNKSKPINKPIVGQLNSEIMKC